ncbi:MAG: class I SAM-dependent methyltransferase [Elusimicrobia bacterium]|nr:class I SAM-dependent methyltransferase [Elusimicrobiota bacterium]
MTSGGDWPEADTERLGRCPVCGSEEQVVLHEQLEDRTHFCAPGRWTLRACGRCACAYLDPRPNEASIARAYSGYYTHDGDAEPAPSGRLGRLRLAARNGHLRSVWGVRREPASGMLGALLVRGPVVLARLIDQGELRGLPRPGGGRLLLDVGCGNGRFLRLAQEAGWRGRGIDFDAGAVEAARRQGLDASVGGVEALAGEADRYDAVTLSHVVEHVHDPRALLAACRRLLKPGGYFWVETPNVRSRGHAHFGRDWRGLEPPRHLVLFTPRALRGLLKEVGFSRVETGRWRPTYPWMDMSSRAVRDGRRQDELRATPLTRAWSALVEAANAVGAEGREFVTLTATKEPAARAA